MDLDEPRWIRALSSQRHWGLGGVRPTPSPGAIPALLMEQSLETASSLKALACWPQRPGGCQAEQAQAVNTSYQRE